ncbi:hypothetical protein SCL_0985 [Sulfuricaulis limicola]|uniref:Uncharacterized protein n=1 Tax=Sulfuricaulis limicola TaxID=1620215 RepID=A0A1B4XER5_9GAMM|nr:hypothetical protein SCL_0985 [Sulfuricaulis limicola]
MLNGAESIKIHGEYVPVRAESWMHFACINCVFDNVRNNLYFQCKRSYVNPGFKISDQFIFGEYDEKPARHGQKNGRDAGKHAEDA